MLSNIWKDFKNHAESGAVPIKLREGVEKQHLSFSSFSYKDYVPKNCFYQSLDRVGSVTLPVKKTVCYLAAISATLLTNIVLQPLYLAFAYLSYLPAKLVSNKTEGRLTLRKDTESLVDYSNMFFYKNLS